MTTDLLFLRDAYLRSARAEVTHVDGVRIALDRTVFYPTGGGQPHDTGTLSWDGGTAVVTEVRKGGDAVWHTLEGDIPAPGTEVTAEIDWDRRHRLMRTHTALHVLCGVIWNEWGVPVTGGNMEPLSARLDFELDPPPRGGAGRSGDPHQGQPGARIGGRDQGGRHRRPRPPGRRRHPRPHHRRGGGGPRGQDRGQGKGNKGGSHEG